MDRQFIVPSNSKKQGLIFGFMKLPDVFILSIGVGLSFILFMSIPVDKIGIAILCLLPILISGFLVFPIPNYHNTRYLIGVIIRYYFQDIRKYYWRGWCYQYERPNEQSDEQSDELSTKLSRY